MNILFRMNILSWWRFCQMISKHAGSTFLFDRFRMALYSSFRLFINEETSMAMNPDLLTAATVIKPHVDRLNFTFDISTSSQLAG